MEIVIILIGMLIVIGGIIGFKMHPFFALIAAAIVVAILTPLTMDASLVEGGTVALSRKISITQVGNTVANEFGKTATKVGIIVVMAAIIGRCMTESGAAEKIVRSILRLLVIENTAV